MRLELIDQEIDGQDLKALEIRLIKSLIVHFLFLGIGCFVFNRSKKSIVYFLLALYGWLSFANVFFTLVPELEFFHNKTLFGASTILVAWLTAYIIGAVHLVNSYYAQISLKE